MNSLLISIGVAIVMALSAALIGPAFIDWNGYRATIQEAGAGLTGRQVTISGALDVKILPAPVLRAKEVTLFSPEDGNDTPLATAREVVLRLDLGALLLGRAEITDLEIIGARLQVKVKPDGTVNWGAKGAGPARDARGTTLRRVVLSDATLDFDDEAAGIQRRLAGINAEITASALSGPFRLVGSFGKSRDRRKFVLTTGALRAGGPLRVGGRLDVPFGAQLSFDGGLTGLGGAPRFAGRFKLVKTLDKTTRSQSGEPGRAVLEASIDAGLRDVEMSKLALAVTASGQTLNLAGSGRLAWRDDPAFNIELKALRLDADALLAAAGPAQPGVQSLGAIAGSARSWIKQTGASGRLALKASSVLARGELVQDIGLAIDVSAGKLAIETFKARFPGQADISISGVLPGDDSQTGFDGKVFVNALDIGRFVRWVMPARWAQFMAYLPATRGKLSLRAGLKVDGGKLAVSGIDALLDGQAVSGDIVVVPAGQGGQGDQGELRAKLSFDSLDLDRRFGAGGSASSNGSQGSDAPAAAAGDIGQAPVFRLGLDVKRARWRGLEARNARLDATLEAGRWKVAAFTVNSFAGAKIAGRGTFAQGLMTPGAKVGAGARVSLTLETANLPELIKALPGGPTLLERLGADRTRQLRAAQLELGLKAGKTAKGWQLDGSAAGAVDGTIIAFKGAGEADAGDLAASTVNATLTLANRRGDQLLALLGLPALEQRGAAGATASLAVQSVAGGHLRIAASASALKTEFTVTAALDPAPLSYRGKAKILAPSSAGIAGFLALAPPVGALPVALDIAFSGDADGVSVIDLTGQAAGARLSAAGEMVFGARPRASLSVAIDQLSLPWLLGSVFLTPTSGASTASAQPSAAWSTDLINIEVLDIADLAIKAAIGRLALSDNYAIYDADAQIDLAGGGLKVSGLRGRLGPSQAAGRLRAGLAAEVREFSLGLGGEITLAKADLARLLTDKNGRALMRGQVDMKAKFAARGRSLASLVSSLEGSGALTVTKAAVPRLDWAGLRRTSGQVAGSGAGGGGGLVSSLLKKSMSGQTPITLAPGALKAANGRIRFGPLTATTQGSKGEVTSFVDLPARRFDQELVLGNANTARLAVIHAGKLAEISREIEVTNLAGGAIRMVEPASSAAREIQPRKGVLPPRPGLEKIRKAAMRSPEAVSLPKALPLPKVALPPQAPVKESPQLPAGLIEQRLIDLPLPEISGATPAAPPAPEKPVVPPA